MSKEPEQAAPNNNNRAKPRVTISSKLNTAPSNPGSVNASNVYKFNNKTRVLFGCAGLLGIYLGLRLCDILFYRPEKHQLLRQTMEDEYWAKFGEPTMLEPEIVKSLADPSKLRKSWIQIVLGKDKYIKKDQD